MLTAYLWCYPIVVGKAEQGCLHAKRQQNQYQCHVGIDIGADAIVAGIVRHIVSVERNQQIVQEPAYDTRQPIDGRILH